MEERVFGARRGAGELPGYPVHALPRPLKGDLAAGGAW